MYSLLLQLSHWMKGKARKNVVAVDELVDEAEEQRDPTNCDIIIVN